MIKEIDYNCLKDFNIKNSSTPFTRYIGYFNHDLCGYIEYNDIYNTIDIVNVYVKEKYRNKNIATEMFKYLIDKNKDKENITLEVSCENNIALKLYKKLGFKKVAIRKGYYKGIDGYLMELIL